MSTPKKTIPKRSKDGKTLAGSISLGGKKAPVAANKVINTVDLNPIRNKTDISKFNLVKRNSFPQELYKAFPVNMDLHNGILLYEEVAKSMLALAEEGGDLLQWKIPRDMGPRYNDLVGIWTAMNNLGVWNSRDIQREVYDRGENVKDLAETCMGYLNESYGWAYDSLMEYVGGYSYVHYGPWGEWVPQGTKLRDDDAEVFASPAAQRAQDRQRQRERMDAHNAQFKE